MKIIISNSSSVPIYEQIKNQIINQIMLDELLEGESIPSIRSLASDIKISVMTIKKAYDELESEGYIKSVQGKGTFVAPKNIELAKNYVDSLNGTLERLQAISKLIMNTNIRTIIKSNIIKIFFFFRILLPPIRIIKFNFFIVICISIYTFIKHNQNKKK